MITDLIATMLSNSLTHEKYKENARQREKIGGQMMLVPFWVIEAAILSVLFLIGIIVGGVWSQESYLPKIKKYKQDRDLMEDELNYYRSQNHRVYPGKDQW